MLLDGMPLVLVEPGQVRRPGRAAAGVPLPRRLARPGDQRTARRSGRPIPVIPLPYHHELRRCVPEGVEPDRGDRQHQGYDGQAYRMRNQESGTRNQDSGFGIQNERLGATLLSPESLILTPDLKRVRWRARRGLLELDIVLGRFVAASDALLDMPDIPLWDMIAGRREAAPGEPQALLEKIRAA